MAVESTPERSFSDLFSSSRAAEATTGCGLSPEMRRRHHGAQRRFDRSPRVGKEIRDACERLVSLGVEDVQDRADQERMAGLLPMVPPLERAFGIDQDVGDVLDVAHLAVAAPDLEQRIVGGGFGLVGSNSRTRPNRARQPAVSVPVLALDVVDDGGPGPGEQRRDDQADALAGPGGRKAQHVFRSIMAQIVATEATRAPRRPAREGPLRGPPARSPSAPSHRSSTFLASRARQTDMPIATAIAAKSA